MSVRTDVAALLAAGLGSGFRVLAHPRSLDSLGGPTDFVVLDSVERLPAAPEAGLLVTLRINLAVPGEDPSTVDDDLERGLDALIAALESITALRWSRAERVMLESRWHSYQLAATAVGRNASNGD